MAFSCSNGSENEKDFTESFPAFFLVLHSESEDHMLMTIEGDCDPSWKRHNLYFLQLLCAAHILCPRGNYLVITDQIPGRTKNDSKDCSL